MRDFRKLKVWEKSHMLALEVYRITRGFPPAEVYGMQAQMRRASVSVASNIAEGSGRSGRAELGQFLNWAAGSVSELEYQLLLARDLGFLNGGTYTRAATRAVEVKRMLAGLLRRVRADLSQSPRASPKSGRRSL